MSCTVCKELCENNHYSMRRMNSSWQGGGVSHSGAMSNDDNAGMTNSDKQNEVIIDAQLLMLRLRRAFSSDNDR